MMKRAISILTALVMIFVLLPASAMPLSAESAIWDGSIASGFARGAGTEADPYIIETAPQLAFLASSTSNYSGKYIKLVNEIVLNDTSNWANWSTTAPANNWTPIGSGTTFQGTFDGGCHTVSGIYIKQYSSSGGTGLFRYLESGKIMNVGVTASYIKGISNVAGIVGNVNNGVIENCFNNSIIVGTNQVGGIIGDMYTSGTIQNCYNSGIIKGDQNVGGIIGTMTNNGSGLVNNCYNTGTITGNSKVGGIVGMGTCAISNCYSIGKITGDSSIGGIAGNIENNTGINCYYLTGSAPYGINGADVTGKAEVLTDAQMRLHSSFITWDFTSVWEFGGNGVDYYYPTLTALRKAGSTSVITINYQYTNGNPAAETVTQTLFTNDSYAIVSPVIDGFSPDLLVVSGVIGEEDIIVTVIYSIAENFIMEFARGTGIESDPFIIKTAQQLTDFAKDVNRGTNYNGKYIKIANDIALNDTSDWENWETTAPTNSWTPIGTESNWFQGIFDGDGHTVSGIYIKTSADCQGLFGYFNQSFESRIINIGVRDSYISGGYYIGGIVGYVNSVNITIDNCSNTGMIKGIDYVGGVVGYGTAAGCYNTGIISGNSYVGGAIGSGAAENCYNSGSVSGQNDYIGGVVGGSTSLSNTRDNYNVGAVTGNKYIGGVVGRINGGYLINCYSTGVVTGNSNTGGVTGFVSANVSRCYYLAGTASGGINGSDVAGKATAMTEAQMKQQSNFIGWDFAYNWFMDSRYCYNDGTPKEFPQLQAFGNFSTVPSSAVWDGTTDVNWEGTGTETSPYLISTVEELAGVAENSKITNYSGKYFKLTTDIVLNNSSFLYWQHSAVEWIPIGNIFTFDGTFNGDGHTVSGIYINQIGISHGQGLFGYLSSGDVENLGVINGYIRGGNNVGGITGSAYYSAIDECYNTCIIIGTGNQIGGVVGNIYTAGAINGCYNTGIISGRQNIGGIAGNMTLNGTGTITNCYNTSSVLGISQVGGIVGSGSCEVSNCYNTGIVNSTSTSSGIMGNKGSSTASHCYYLNGTAAGGISGANIAGQAEALTDAQMKQQPSFVGWDFNTVWEFSGVAGDYYYPTLSALRESVTRYTLTINYRYLEGNTAAQSVIQYLRKGDTYSVSSPSVSGYRPDVAVVSGEVGEENITVNVTYIWDGSAAAGFASGTGTETDPFIIETSPQLAFLANSVNGGTTYSGKYIKLTKDIMLNDTTDWESWNTTAPANSWISIGTSSHKFMGTFNGDGHTVSGIYINTTADYQGLFGYAEGSAIGNLGVIKSLIKGGIYVGGIAGYSGSMISNCYNTGTVKGNSTVGGVAGKGVSYITNCFNTGVVTGTGDQVGGITGLGTAKDCYNTGTVSGYRYVGGISGYLNSDIVVNSYNIGAVSGSSNVGGVVGYVERGVVISCYYLSGTATGGINGVNVAGQAEALTSEQMKQKSNFVGWDFAYEWFTDAQYRYDSSSEYPQLQAFGDFSSIPVSAIWNGSTDTDWTGNGTENDPYLITSSSELAGLAYMVNSGTGYSGIYFKLITDIVLNDTQSIYWQHGAVQWNPIGNLPKYFRGIFDGDGHTVSGIYINSLGNYKGLFGGVNSGTIKNIRVIESRIKGTQNVGGISGIVVFGTINNCSNAGKHSGRVSIGGIVGYANQSTVINCNNTGTTTGGSFQIGGVVGNLFSGTVSNCCNTGMIIAGSGGGLAGYIDNNSIVDNCYNTGIIKGVAGIGGLAGSSSGTVKNSYNTGVISGHTEVGGIVGGYYGTVNNCYNTGAISGILAVGGVVGYVSNTGNVSNCYNTGAVSGDHNISGVAGTVYSSGTVSNCYNIGRVSGNFQIGGVAGYLNSSGLVSSCYYLSGVAAGGINSSDVADQAEVLTDAKMKTQANFINWDFASVWEFGGIAEDYYYPTLRVFRKPVTGVTLSDESITLGLNTTKQLAATILPADATYKNVIWSSSDNTVATVSSTGLITVLKTGKAVITVTTKDEGLTENCTVIAVNPADEANYSYTINNDIVTVTRFKDTRNSATVPTHLGGYPVTEIGSGCFANCTALVRVYFPVSITAIAADAFSGCSNLKFIYFSGNAPAIVSSGNRSGNRQSESPFGAGVTVYFRTGTTGWDNPTWTDKATGIVPGDINGDGKLNMNDAVSFVQRLTQGSSATYTQSEFAAADVVRDGAVNMSDIVKMVQALANPLIVLY